MLTRRTLFGGLALLAAPAIIRTPGLLMPVKTLANRLLVRGWEASETPGLSVGHLLLPGVHQIDGSYAEIPAQWARLFA